MDNKIIEIFIPGPAGRLQAKYFKSKKNTSPIVLILPPHPQYGGTMNNKVVVDTFNTFVDNQFSVCRVNFRGVGKSDGEFDNGQGELADAAATLDWLEKENFENSQCWISGFSFGSLIAMQLLMRRPEINRFVSISPQPNVYDFSFLSPCPASGLVVYGKKDELVPQEYIEELNNKLSAQKGIRVEFQVIPDANHFFATSSTALIKSLDKYIKKETTLF
jgi:alpha/beta superfamily hydrolase